MGNGRGLDVEIQKEPVCVDRWRFIYGGVWLLGMKKIFHSVELKAWERTKGGGSFMSASIVNFISQNFTLL